MKALNEGEILERLQQIPGWTYSQGCITRVISGSPYLARARLLVEIAKEADAADHHPEIILDYNNLSIALTTHSARGVSEKDFALALKISELVDTNKKN